MVAIKHWKDRGATGGRYCPLSRPLTEPPMHVHTPEQLPTCLASMLSSGWLQLYLVFILSGIFKIRILSSTSNPGEIRTGRKTNILVKSWTFWSKKKHKKRLEPRSTGPDSNPKPPFSVVEARPRSRQHSLLKNGPEKNPDIQNHRRTEPTGEPPSLFYYYYLLLFIIFYNYFL